MTDLDFVVADSRHTSSGYIVRVYFTRANGEDVASAFGSWSVALHWLASHHAATLDRFRFTVHKGE